MKNITPRALPEFAKGATMYQIFLRQFTPQGTLKAAEEMIPHLADLGIRIAYLCPMFEADDDMNRKFWSKRQLESGMNNPKNPYRMNDYFKIDPEYGTDDDLASFVKTAHKYGLRIMLDLVYLHCGPRANLLSMDPEFIQRDKKGKPILGFWNFPLLNFKSKKLREYLISNMMYFIEKFGIDGYRCDVGDSVPLDFWEEARRRIDKIRPDFIMLDEAAGIIEDERSAFELVYGFRAYSIISVMKGEKTPGELRSDWQKIECGLRIMNHLDNHDIASDDYEERHERILPAALNDMSFAFIFGLAGMPLLYNGQEIADSNRHSLWANHEYGHHLGIDWKKALTPRGKERFEFVQDLISLRKDLEILTEGTQKYLKTDRDDAVFAYLREWNGEKMLCVFNFSGKALDVKVKGVCLDEADPVLEKGISISGKTISMLPYAFAWIEL